MNKLMILTIPIIAIGILAIIVMINPNVLEGAPSGFPTKGNFSAFGYQWLCYGHDNLTCEIANPPSDYLDGGLGGNTTNGYNCDVFGVHMWCHRQ